jgi:hypothetical protein
VQLTGLSGRVEGDTFAAKDDVPISCAPNGGADVVYRLDLARRSRVTARLVGTGRVTRSPSNARAASARRDPDCSWIGWSSPDLISVVDGARPVLGRFGLAPRAGHGRRRSRVHKVPSLAFQRKVGTTAGAADRSRARAAFVRSREGTDRSAASVAPGCRFVAPEAEFFGCGFTPGLRRTAARSNALTRRRFDRTLVTVLDPVPITPWSWGRPSPRPLHPALGRGRRELEGAEASEMIALGHALGPPNVLAWR